MDNSKELKEELDHFIYLISHDLRSPIVNLKGFTSELNTSCKQMVEIISSSMDTIDQKKKPEIQKAIESDIPQFLRFINMAVKDLETMNASLLELSRIDRRELILKGINTNELVDEVLASLRNKLPAFTCEMEDLPDALADRNALKEVFQYIIVHAVNNFHSDRPGKIWISGNKDREETTFRIRDNGRGVHESALSKVFQVSRLFGGKQVPGGGVGMAFVKKLVQRHHGKVHCESIFNEETVITLSLRNY